MTIHLIRTIVHSMNNQAAARNESLPEYQLKHFQHLIRRLFECCQERYQYQSERFGLPDAELRCLMLFGEERYLTPKGIAQKMNVAKSRVSKIINQLVKKKLVRRIKDPADSRVHLLSLTAAGRTMWREIDEFLNDLSEKILLQVDADQRTALLNHLSILERSMEAAKETWD